MSFVGFSDLSQIIQIMFGSINITENLSDNILSLKFSAFTIINQCVICQLLDHIPLISWRSILEANAARMPATTVPMVP